MNKEHSVHLVDLIGPNGSGKGTVAKHLADQHPHTVSIISTGDVVRGSKNPEDPQYGRFHEDLDPYLSDSSKGGLIPDEVMIPIAQQLIAENIEGGKKVIFLDGVNRTREQHDVFDQIVIPDLAQDVNIKHTGVVLEASLKTIVQRSAERYQDDLQKYESGQSTKPPREDDKPNIVVNRYKTYRRKTHRGVVKPLESKGKVHKIDAMQPKDVVAKQVGEVVFQHVATPQEKQVSA